MSKSLPGEALICHNPSIISQTYGGLWWGSILNKIKMLFTRKSMLFYPRNVHLNEAIL